MAKFSKRIVSRYNVESYQGTKKVYKWICNALEPLEKREIIAFFEFRIGNIVCTCQSIDELVEIAYGEKEYKLTGFYINLYLKDGSNISFVCVKRHITIEAKSKTILEKTVELLKKFRNEKNDSINTNVSIHNNYNIGNINGNNNSIVQGNENQVTAKEKQKKESKLKKWLEAILQNLLANWIWLVIPLIFGGIALGLTK